MNIKSKSAKVTVWVSYIFIISKRKATIVAIRTTTTATSWIFRIAAFIVKIISEIYDLPNCFEWNLIKASIFDLLNVLFSSKETFFKE